MSRRTRRWILLAWPGLAHLWVRGSWAGLALSLGFTALLALLGVSRLVWTEWLPPEIQMFLAAALAAIWLAAAAVTLQTDLLSAGPEPRHGEPVGDRRPGGGPDLFRSAQAQYLQGDWLAAEQTLRQILTRQPRDVEARLLLATLLRHTSRLEEAAQHLVCLERMEQAERWSFEIAGERLRLADQSDQPVPMGERTTPEATIGRNIATTDAA